MIVFRPFRARHLEQLELQQAQQDLQPLLHDASYARQLAVPGMAWSAELDGRIVGCAGLLPLWHGRLQAWALIGAIPTRHWMAVHRRALHGLAAAQRSGFWRIEAAIDPGWPPAVRWAKALGFDCESVMIGYSPLGRDMELWVRLDEALLGKLRAGRKAA